MPNLCFTAGEAAAIIHKKHKIPFLIQEHSTFIGSKLFTSNLKSYFKSLYEQAGNIITVSKSLKLLLTNKLEIKGQRNILVLPNFIDTTYFNAPALNVKKQNDSAGFIFATISYLTAKKRLDRLLEAFSKAFKGAKDIFLYIGGEGEEKRNIELQIKNLQLTDQVILLGQLDRIEVKNLLNNCDAFVLASDIETFGVVLIESMAAGKPVLATKSGGPEDFVTKDVGILVNTNEPDIINGLINMRSRANDFNTSTIKMYAESNFSSAAVVHKLRSIYEQTINQL